MALTDGGTRSRKIARVQKVGIDEAVPGPICGVGLDGCRAGWIAALAIGHSDRIAATRLQLFDDIDQFVQWREAGSTRATVAIDVPIGLPTAVGARLCDQEARSRLGKRWMCVFAPPDRELFGLDFEAARQVVYQRRAAAPGETFHVLSRQSVQITPKIAEVDRALREHPARQEWLIEVHPEVSFRELAGGDLPPKKKAAGRACRLSLLRDVFADVDQRLETARWLRREVAHDDMLDGYVALWSALRFSRGRDDHLVLGDGQRDAHGLPMQMIV